MDFYEHEYDNMEKALVIFGPRLSPSLTAHVREAYNATDWDWRESDGCTAVSELYWTSKFFPPCVVHDLHCVRAERADTRKDAARVRKYGDKLFFKLNVAFGVPMFRVPFFGFRNSCIGRYLGVRLYWFVIGRWKIKK